MKAAGAATAYSKPSTKSVKVSIIVVNFNGVDYVGRCLESIAATLDDSTELIVVDNGSTDGSTGQIGQTFPEVGVVRSDVNVGFGEGNNIGARHASGEYLVFINPDTEVRGGWWQALVDALERNPGVGCTTSQILLANSHSRLNAAGNDIHISGLTLCRGMGRPASEYEQGGPVSAISGAAFAIKQDLFWHLGGFDRDFFLYMEETDLSWRIQLQGLSCVYVPESVVLHDYELRFGPNKTYYQERNRYRMLLKCLRWSSLVLLAPVLLLAELTTWGYVVIGDRQNWTGKLKAYWHTIIEWRDIMQRRQVVQDERLVTDRQILNGLVSRLDFGQTSSGTAAILADRLLNPLFAWWHRLVVKVVRW